MAAVFLAGCTVEYKMVGQFDDYNELIVGDLVHDLSNGTARITARAQNSDLVCEGHSYVTYKPGGLGCTGQRGRANLECSDGRTAEGEWTANTCTTGFGRGKTSDGSSFRFTFGLTEQEATARLEQLAPRVASKPNLPVYEPKETRKEKGYSTGTGFFVTSSGYFVTNHHVIDDSETVHILYNDSFIPARIIQMDPANDVALLKADVQASPLPVAEITDVGRADEVFTMGYPSISVQGQAQKATFGRINALSGIMDDIRFMQIDVPIQPGNSGGPLIDSSGRVVGVVTATLDALRALVIAGNVPQNVNYAVKSDYLVPMLRTVPGWRAVPSGTRNPFRHWVDAYEKSVVLVVAR